MGTGGYKTAVPKWEAIEADLRARDITPGTDGWPERAKHWWYAHGGTLDPQTGRTIFQDKIPVPSKAIIDAMEDAHKGLFQPDRERDKLTRALGNKEKGGRARGKGGVSWKKVFPQYAKSYRSRKRARDQEANRIEIGRASCRERV